MGLKETFSPLITERLDSLHSTIRQLPSSTPPGPLPSNIFELSNASASLKDWPTVLKVIDTVYPSGFAVGNVRGGAKGVVQIETAMRHAGTTGLETSDDYLKALWQIQAIDKIIESFNKNTQKSNLTRSSSTKSAPAPKPSLSLSHSPASTRPSKAALSQTPTPKSRTPASKSSRSVSIDAPGSPKAPKLPRTRAADTATPPVVVAKRGRGRPRREVTKKVKEEEDSRESPESDASENSIVVASAGGTRAASTSARFAYGAPVLIEYDRFGRWPAVVLDPEYAKGAWWEHKITEEAGDYLVKSLPLGGDWGWYDASATLPFDPTLKLPTKYTDNTKPSPADRKLFKEAMRLACDPDELDIFLENETEHEGKIWARDEAEAKMNEERDE